MKKRRSAEQIVGLLRQAFDEAPAGSIHVLPQRFHRERYVYAGSASRETERMTQYTARLVHAWIGNSENVAEDHYLMVTDEDFLQAAARPSAIPTLIPTPATLAAAHQASSPVTTTAVSPAFANDTAVEVPPRGVEPRFSD